MTLFRYALIGTLSLSTALLGCGEDEASGGGADAGTDSGGADADATGGSGGGANTPEDEIDAGMTAEIPALDSQECDDAKDEDFTPYETADCWSQAEASGAETCAGFYCNWSELQIQCQMGRPLQACRTEADLELGCDSSIQDAVAVCAREAQGRVIAEGFDENNQPIFTQDDAREYTQTCAREQLPRIVSPECLSCYIDSAECARDTCLMECLAGDSRQCDECRETAGCTPAFFECTGFPDPQQLNPDGTDR